MVPVLDMGYGEGPLVGVERLTRSPALLPARLALPACLFLDEADPLVRPVSSPRQEETPPGWSKSGRGWINLLEGFASGDREALTTREFGPVVGCY